MFKPGKYQIIKTDKDCVHGSQGRGKPKVGDIVIVSHAQVNVWENEAGEWCWAVCQDETYGAHFHRSHLRPMQPDIDFRLTALPVEPVKRGGIMFK